MPIKVEDARKYKGYEKTEFKIVKFLDKNKGNAFTLKEIEEGIGRKDIGYAPNEKGSHWTWQNVGSFALNVTTAVMFYMTLDRMVREEKISVSEIGGEEYYFLE